MLPTVRALGVADLWLCVSIESSQGLADCHGSGLLVRLASNMAQVRRSMTFNRCISSVKPWISKLNPRLSTDGWQNRSRTAYEVKVLTIMWLGPLGPHTNRERQSWLSNASLFAIST
ncbi:hypothetical protein BDV19DRAFT_339326 [Aspergillus venezuelensis]